jgi:hypothetical protein
VADKDHKLILIFNGKNNVNEYSEKDIIDREFYDLQKDPSEWDDLYRNESVSEVQKDFKEELLHFLKEMEIICM